MCLSCLNKILLLYYNVWILKETVQLIFVSDIPVSRVKGHLE
jgi:hypothetical protein